jgi:hypothetical protein
MNRIGNPASVSNQDDLFRLPELKPYIYGPILGPGLLDHATGCVHTDDRHWHTGGPGSL